MSELTQEDIDLNYYESQRRIIVGALATEKGILQDTERASLFLKAVDGGSKVAIARKRLAVDQETNANQQQQIDLLSKVITSVPTARQQLDRSRAPLADVDIVVPKTGEIDIGTKELPYSKIMKDA